jgi:rhodanese-related sulfurtransferase
VNRWIKAGLMLLVLALVVGCGSTTVTKQAEVAKQDVVVTADGFSLLQQSADKYLKTGRPLIIGADEVQNKIVRGGDNGYIIVDVRADEHYAKHHIPGAIHISYADAWRQGKTDFLPKDRKIVVVDYSGHSSSQIVALWSLMGFDAIAMKHGMAGWSKDKDIIGGSPLPCETKNFPVVKDVAQTKTYSYPALDVKGTDALDILRKRAEAVAAKPVVIQADDLLAKIKSNAVTVVDTRSPQHFAAGHIQGAINIPFAKIAEPESLKLIPSDQPIVLVCYDGHASSQASRILNQLGYDSSALRDGMSVWTGDAGIIGAPSVACAVTEQPTAQLNAPLAPGPSAAAT